MRLLQVHYADHYTQNSFPDNAKEQPECVNMAYGEVVYEGDEWLKLCHARTDIDGSTEQWDITAIRKCDIVKMRELRYD